MRQHLIQNDCCPITKGLVKGERRQTWRVVMRNLLGMQGCACTLYSGPYSLPFLDQGGDGGCYTESGECSPSIADHQKAVRAHCASLASEQPAPCSESPSQDMVSCTGQEGQAMGHTK